MTEPLAGTPIPMAQEPPAAEAAALEARSLIEQLMAIARVSGPIFRLPLPGPRQIAVWGHALVAEICDDALYDKQIGGGLLVLRNFVGDGLFTAYTDEPNWRKAHSILLPAFAQSAMERYHPGMLDLATQLVEKWARLNPEDEVDVAEEMTRLTLDTIGLCGFSYRFNSFYRSDPHPYVKGMLFTLERAMALAFGGGTGNPLDDPEVAANRAMMDGFIDEIIRQRKADPDAAGKRDLLGFMLTGVDKATGEGLDDRTIRNNINTFLVAGHETTSGLLSFAISFLLNHPAVVARAREEVDRVLGPDPAAPPTYEQVRALPYVSRILKESLRLWPTAPAFSRHPYEPRLLGGTYAIAPDDVLRILTPMLHRDPAVWGPDPERFDPDRFAPERERALPPHAYLPFGTGQRACIGRQFALQEATLVLGMILHRFELIDPHGYQLRIKQALTIKPDGLKIRVRPRPARGRALTAPSSVRSVAAPLDGAEGISRPDTPPPSASHGTPLLVLFGSNLGAAEDLANRIANDATARGYRATVAPLDDRAGDLPTEGAVVIVTASYNGTPPDNAARFCAWLQDGGLGPDALRGVRYAVFGCGNHEWTATYQAIPRLVDAGLAAHGAERIYPRGEGDAAADFDGQFEAWVGPLWEALAAALGLGAGATVAAKRALYAVERVSAPANPFIQIDGVRPMTVRVNRELQGAGSERSTLHIEVALPDGTGYRTGDHLGVFPRNPLELVVRALRRFGFAGDAYVRIARNGAGAPSIPLDQPVPVVDLLSRYLDLQEVASRAQIGTLAEHAGASAAAAELRALTEDGRYAEEVLAKRISLLDLLERFPDCALPFNVYLELLHPLRVRYYSISSSPLVDPRVCSITVAVVDAPARSGRGRYQGVGSTYLARHPADSVIDAYVRTPSIPFHPPEDPRTPIVMIGPGTGLAPFRGFLQERAALLARGQRLGEALLFFGCRRPDHDFLYREELEAFAEHGIVRLFTAFSRPDDGAKAYVQDRIREQADLVWKLLEEGATVYVCGDGGRMEPAVRQTLIDLYAAKMGAPPEAATAWQVDLAARRRYLADVWAQG